MKKLISSVVLLVFIVNMTGCATILKPKETKMKVSSNPEGAEIYQTTEKMFSRKTVRVGRTPTTLTISNKRAVDLAFKKDGYEESTYTLQPHKHAGWMLASFACLIIPGFIDLVTHNTYYFREKEVKVTLDPALSIGSKGSNVDEIIKWKKLLDSGAITKEEYDQKKKQLLGG